jgi:hypothetical protein
MASRTVLCGNPWGFFRREFPQPAACGLFQYPKLLRRGQASLEILIVLLFLIPLLFGAFELARGVAIRAALDSGIGIAARALAIDPDNWDWAAARAGEAVARNVFGSGGVGTVNFEAYNSGGTRIYDSDFAALHYGETFCLRGWANYTASVPLLPLGTITLRVEHCGVIERMETP